MIGEPGTLIRIDVQDFDQSDKFSVELHDTFEHADFAPFQSILINARMPRTPAGPPNVSAIVVVGTDSACKK